MRKQFLLTALSLALLAGCGTPENNVTELPVRKACLLERLYQDMPREIDWTKTNVSREEAYAINLVDEFHGGCGMKPQEEY